MTNTIRVGVVGAAGFTGGELLRILLNHPQVSLSFAHSRSQAGKKLFELHKDLLGDTELTFTNELQLEVDVLFLCMGHGESQKFLADNTIPETTRIIDLSHDFRISPDLDSLIVENKQGDFVYGLPELNRDRITRARFIANPGCFATCLQLALLPLAEQGDVHTDVHISATTGSTGAGQKLVPTNGFTWRTANISTYKAFTHQHLREVRQMLAVSQNGKVPEIHFLPHRGNFTRGILASCYLNYSGTTEQAQNIYNTFYKSHPFTHISAEPLDVKQVVNTNKCFIHVEVVEGRLLITAVIDNLLKGASGQAVQNMNLLFGLPETLGLKLKGSAF